MSTRMRMLMSHGFEGVGGDGARTLLIVDNDPQVRAILVRRLGAEFEATREAKSATEAEEILDAHEVTHVVCDAGFEDGLLTADELLAAWTKRYLRLIRAVALEKTRGLSALIAALTRERVP